MITTKNQTEALKKVFSAYEKYIINSDGSNSFSYAKDVLDTIPELAVVFPAISLLETNDKFGIFKNIYFMENKGEIPK